MLFLLRGKINDGVGYVSSAILFVYKECMLSPISLNTVGIKYEKAVPLQTGPAFFLDSSVP